MTYYPPSTQAGILAAVRQAQATGRCTICGAPIVGGGATCKHPYCVRWWVLGKAPRETQRVVAPTSGNVAPTAITNPLFDI